MVHLLPIRPTTLGRHQVATWVDAEELLFDSDNRTLLTRRPLTRRAHILSVVPAPSPVPRADMAICPPSWSCLDGSVGWDLRCPVARRSHQFEPGLKASDARLSGIGPGHHRPYGAAGRTSLAFEAISLGLEAVSVKGGLGPALVGERSILATAASRTLPLVAKASASRRAGTRLR
jgi:hypothetical protein